jgi:hypothetical protein
MTYQSKIMPMMVAFMFALMSVVGVGCSKDDGKKPGPAKKSVKAAPDKKAPEKKVPEKKEPEKKQPEKKNPEAKEVVKKEPEKKQPTPAEKLTAVEAGFKMYSFEAGKVEQYLADLKALETGLGDAPEAEQAYLLGAVTRLDFVVASSGGKPELIARLMAADGAIEAGHAAEPEKIAAYYKQLATEFATRAKSMKNVDNGKGLEVAAALLNYLHDETLEQAGKLEGAKLVLPEEWTTGEGEDKESSEKEVKKEVVAAATGEASPTAEAAPADKKPPFVTDGGADVSTLLALATGDNAVALQARTLVLNRLANALDEAGKGSTDYFFWWQAVAASSGKVLCTACPFLATVPVGHLEEVLFLGGNRGIVCKAAMKETLEGMPVADAIVKNCAEELGVAEGDRGLITPANALAFRFFALAHQMLGGTTPAMQSKKLFAEYNLAGDRVKKHFVGKMGLFPPFEIFPRDKWEEMKDKLVFHSEINPGTPGWSFMPLEAMIIDEKGVNEAIRPIAGTDKVPFEFVDSKEGLRFPGKLVADIAAIATELEAKNKKLEEEKRPYDSRLKVYLEEVTIRGTVFKKPDFSIPSVVEAAKKLSGKAGSFESAVFPYLMDAQVLNHLRPKWPEFQDTVGKATLYAVDQATPALLFKRIVDSLYYADYKDSRLVKATGAFDTVPTVYFTEKFVADEVLDTTYKRPILVYVTEGGTVRFYPPTNRTAKGKMTAKRHPRVKDTKWPGNYRAVEDPRNPDPLWNLFMAYTREGSTKFEEEFMGIAGEMKKKWDNGNVFYLKAQENAPAGLVVKAADMLANLPESAPIGTLDKAFPGYGCDVEKAPEQCINNIVVLFPDVEIPALPGKKKVKEVEQQVYCDKDDIAKKINAKRGAIKFCYDPELQKNPNLKGKVVFNFTIGATGRITSINTASDGLGNSKVVNCTMGVLKRISFRRPIGGECKIRYPYVFSP